MVTAGLLNCKYCGFKPQEIYKYIRLNMEETLLNPGQQKNLSSKSSVFKTGRNINKIKLKNASARNKVKRKAKKFQLQARPAIYIGHIPHGFYEDEMSAYFNQFGKVHSTVVVRSKKTGRSKGYGFVEFESEEVAKIAAETMNNYLMFNRVLKCKYIPPEGKRRRISFKTIYPTIPKTKNRVLDFKNKRNAFMALDQDSYQKKAQKKIDNLKKFFEEKEMNFIFKETNDTNYILGSWRDLYTCHPPKELSAMVRYCN